VLLQQAVGVGLIAEQMCRNVHDVMAEQVAGLSADAAAYGLQRLWNACPIHHPLLENNGIEQQVARPKQGHEEASPAAHGAASGALLLARRSPDLLQLAHKPLTVISV
jgi:hypothetical protein